MKRLTLLLSLAIIGCSETITSATPDASIDVSATSPMCEGIASTDNIVFQDCGAVKLNGLHCVEGCGRLPQDGGLGTLLGSGCTVDICVSTCVTSICVASCSECQ